VYHDSRFTYIEASSQNAPALYEVLDGKASVVQYELQNGKYVVGHVMTNGLLRAGKTKLEFNRSKDNI
jgi:type IV secretion system protein VirB9